MRNPRQPLDCLSHPRIIIIFERKRAPGECGMHAPYCRPVNYYGRRSAGSSVRRLWRLSEDLSVRVARKVLLGALCVCEFDFLCFIAVVSVFDIWFELTDVSIAIICWNIIDSHESLSIQLLLMSEFVYPRMNMIENNLKNELKVKFPLYYICACSRTAYFHCWSFPGSTLVALLIEINDIIVSEQFAVLQ